MKKNKEDPEQELNNFYVDVPPSTPDGEDGYGTWINIDSFKTRQEAIDFAKEHFGADDEGKVSLISG